MRRNLSVVLALAFLVGIAGPSLTDRAQAEQLAASGLSKAAINEYVTLADPRTGEPPLQALQTWALRHKMQIVKDAGRNLFVPDQAPVDLTPEQAGACDFRQCPQAGTLVNVLGFGGKVIGIQPLVCTAGSCKWVMDPILKKWKRVCGNYTCKNDGPMYPMR